LIIVCFLPWSVFGQKGGEITTLVKEEVQNNHRFTSQELENTSRYRLVSLNYFEDARELHLNLFEDQVNHGILLRKELHPCGSTSYIYRLKDQVWGYFIISDTRGTKWGKLESDSGNQYIITPVKNQSYYLIKELGGLVQEETECATLPQLSKKDKPEQSQSNLIQLDADFCDAASTCPVRTVNMLAYYSASARNSMGGTSAAQSAIATAVSEMNLINTNSQVNHNYALVHTQETSYNESGSFSTDLGRLAGNDDGYMDDVHDARDLYYADLVSLVLASGGCGIGYVNTNSTEFSPSAGFHVASVSCMSTNKTLAHEAGHNMGMHHDRYVAGNPSRACDWAFGYANPGQGWRSVMAYNNQCSDAGTYCTRLPHWSNPDVNYNGQPTGVPNTSSQSANGAYLLNRVICDVATFRTEPCTDCLIYNDCNDYNPLTAGGPGNVTNLSISGPFAPAGSGDVVQLCVTTQGDNSGAGETFNVIDELGNTIGQTNPSIDCGRPDRVCFNVSNTTYNAWIANNLVTVSLDPLTNQINPTLCNDNRACAEITLVQESANPCISGGNFAGDGGVQDMNSGSFHYNGPVTLSNYNIPDPENVIVTSNQEITLSPSFTVEYGATLTLDIEACATAAAQLARREAGNK
jgi:hypothetical protein